MVTSKKLSIQSALNRLKGITGFASTLCYHDDHRPTVFNRYDHINRVWWVNQSICKLFNADPTQSNEIVVLHDLNRWPFAQNLEKGYFNQAENAEEYLMNLNADISQVVIEDVIMLHRKQLSGMRENAKYAFISDIITGFVEDPIMIISGLNVHPELIPSNIVEMLGLDFSNEGIISLRELCEVLNRNKDINKFLSMFQTVFKKQFNKTINRYVDKYDTAEKVFEAIFNDASYVKSEFLKPVIFPINNEYVCHANWIQSNVMIKIINDLGYQEANRFLLSIDEAELLDFIIRKNYVLESEIYNFYPDLDYSTRFESTIKSFL